MSVPPPLKPAGLWRTFEFCRSKFKQIELWSEADEAGQFVGRTECVCGVTAPIRKNPQVKMAAQYQEKSLVLKPAIIKINKKQKEKKTL